jgi:hypothetical protein
LLLEEPRGSRREVTKTEGHGLFGHEEHDDDEEVLKSFVIIVAFVANSVTFVIFVAIPSWSSWPAEGSRSPEGDL